MFKLQKGYVSIVIDNTTAVCYGPNPREGGGPFKHLTDDYDIKCWASSMDESLRKDHNTLVTYQHLYSHQKNSVKLMKVYQSLTLVEAIKRAKKTGVRAKVNIACDKEAED